MTTARSPMMMTKLLGVCRRSAPALAGAALTLALIAAPAFSQANTQPVPQNPVNQPPAKGERKDTQAGGSPAPVPAPGEPLTVAGITMTPPVGWKKEKPSSGMRAAQYAIPDPAGADKPGGTVAYFANIGGTVDDNINRWIAQIADSTEGAQREEFTVGALKVNTLKITGTYSTGGMGGPAEPQKDTTMLGAVISGGPTGPVFIKATGPKALMQSNEAAWKEMLKGVKM